MYPADSSRATRFALRACTLLLVLALTGSIVHAVVPRPAGSDLAAGDSASVSRTWRIPDGESRAACIAGGYAYVGNGGALDVYDLNTDARVQRVVVPGLIEDVEVQGGYAYVCAGRAGFHVVALGSSPHVVATLPPPPVADAADFDCALTSTHAVIAAGWGGMRVVDISDPTAPFETGALESLGYVDHVAANSARLAMSSGSSVYLVSITDPSLPTDRVSVYVGSPEGLAWSGSTLYVAESSDGLVKLSSPTDSTLVEIGRTSAAFSGYDVTMQGNYAYVVDGNGFVHTLTTLTLGQTDVRSGGNAPCGSCQALASGSSIVVLATDVGVQRYSIGPSGTLSIGPVWPIGGTANRMAVAGNQLYVASTTGVYHYDITGTPAHVDDWSALDVADVVAFTVSGVTYAAVATGSSLRILHSTASGLVPVGSVSVPAFLVEAHGNYVYAITRYGVSSQLRIYDVSTAGAPVQVQSLGLPYGIIPYDMSIDPNGAYLYETGYNDLNVYDVSIPASASKIGSWSDGYNALRVAASASQVAVFTGAYTAGQGVKILDVTNPASPMQVGVVDARDFGALDGSLLYTAEFAVYDIGSPAAPLRMGAYDTGSPVAPFGSSIVALPGSRALLSSRAGIYAFDYTVPNTPPGDSVVVAPVDPGTGSSPVTVAFDTVTSGGNTTLEITPLGPPVPGTFAAGNPPDYFNISTEATTQGNITVCVQYDPASVAGAESAVRLLHWDDTLVPPDWVDVTVSVDTVANIVCGATTHLSPFVYGVENVPLPTFVESFDARAASGDVTLSWRVATDVPLEGFRITRSNEAGDESATLPPAGLIRADATSYLDVPPAPGRYTYSLHAIGRDGSRVSSPARTVSVRAPRIALGIPSPNPFVGGTHIPFSLDRDRSVRIDVFDVAGRRVTRLVDRRMAPGTHSVRWDGRNDRGRRPASGVYFVRMRVEGRAYTRKLLLVR